jgi:pyruvate dehydrogenase E1 component beta subunit
MTINFSLLALDQIINNAATIRHMSDGQFEVPFVIRTATGAGRQVAAQHSHSFEGWFAHIPGIKILSPATVEDAFGMLWSAVEDPNPVLICEHVTLYNLEGEVDTDIESVNINKAAIRRPGKDITIIAYSAMVHKALQAAEELSKEGIDAEVIDLRVLRPLDTETIISSVTKTHRAVIVDEGWKSGSLSAEIMARIMENAFYELDAPIARVCSKEVPVPYSKHLEEAAIPQVTSIIEEVRKICTNLKCQR